MGLGHLRVKAGTLVTAEWANKLIAVMESSGLGTGPATIRTPSGRHDMGAIGGGGAALDLVVIREIPDPNGIKLMCEPLVRGKNFAVAGDNFGRYVGKFEFVRDGESPPEPMPAPETYLKEYETFGHTLASEWECALWPFADEAGGWGDTDVNETDPIVVFKFDGSWMVLCILRLFVKLISAAAVARDCLPVEAEEGR